MKLRAERKLGLLLGETVRPGNPQLLQAETIGLDDIGISRIQSHRFQTEASLPEEDFEQHITETKTRGGELTSAGVYRAAKRALSKCDPGGYVERNGKLLLFATDF